jgi:hypothetical protein
MESSRKNSQEKESEKVMPNDDKKKKSGGLLNDLAMGLGLKDRDASYYNRTAKTIGRTQGADAQQRYMRSSGYGRPQAGLFSFLGGGNNQGSNNQGGGLGNKFANVFGYRDMTDMGDGGGRYASGGYHQGGGAYSGLANLGAVLSGGEQDAFSFAPEVDQLINKTYGEYDGLKAADYFKAKEPKMYQMLGQNIIKQNFRGGFF